MPYNSIQYEPSDGIGRVVLNRPEKLNALSQELQDELMDCLLKADDDPEIRVMTLRANGRAFSAGYDIAPPANQTPEEATKARERRENIRFDLHRMKQIPNRWSTLLNLSKPVIAGVHGYCLAGGTDLALHCDIIIAAEDAVFGLPDVRGIESVENHMWTYLVGPQWAKRMMLTGDPIDGKTAERIGLVLKAVPADKLEEEVLTLAGRIANIPLELLAPHKSLINKVMGLMGHAVAQQLALDTATITHHSDARRKFNELAEKEGLRAALQHRDGPFGDYTARPRK